MTTPEPERTSYPQPYPGHPNSYLRPDTAPTPAPRWTRRTTIRVAIVAAVLVAATVALALLVPSPMPVDPIGLTQYLANQQHTVNATTSPAATGAPGTAPRATTGHDGPSATAAPSQISACDLIPDAVLTTYGKIGPPEPTGDGGCIRLSPDPMNFVVQISAFIDEKPLEALMKGTTKAADFPLAAGRTGAGYFVKVNRKSKQDDAAVMAIPVTLTRTVTILVLGRSDDAGVMLVPARAIAIAAEPVLTRLAR
ncbi:hypothetical protein GCM10010174_03770 [Kutzneria viridogrisea]|uniref:DUF3558 domain-containing protein n=1 Tax=Kutzneria viridogrisea TaxID=47990 RepID=A0ABR6BRS5_9PSEU|nr:hypothetical protein [Kutzneria viridogrisea]